ncbi:MAG: GNAT family N-acetyltransferase [Acidimicrobiales bacterium]
MTKLDTVQLGADRLRIGPWRGDPRVAYIAPATGRPPSVDAVTECVRLLRRQGYDRALTSALTRAERTPFDEAGFGEHERLHLLRHDLYGLPARPPRRLRRGRWRDQPAVLAVDAAAFDPFWRFDARGLGEARTATPVARFRVAELHRHLVGYAISGRAGTISYLQRLAVHPDAQGSGLGYALVVDALRWAHRRGAASMLVNTQERNGRALDLYERVGFRREANGLVVLALDLVPAPTTPGAS